MADLTNGWRTVRGRPRNVKRNFDIATDRNFNKNDNKILTTFFFTNFPERYGAKAVFNAFHNFGDIMEVVIPAKRDKGGRRFGFARFDQVEAPYKLENDLDNIIFGGEKISVNISRFQRSEGIARGRVDEEAKEGQKASEHKHRSRSRPKLPLLRDRSTSRFNGKASFAQVVKKSDGLKVDGNQSRVAFEFEVGDKELERFNKAFVGVTAEAGMSYNIQNAFHAQGYFGVKVTPLGSNLTLLEGQEDGEVEALLEDASEWMEQWFKEIRPWKPNDVDLERIIWLRIFGIPVHAWNDGFFSKVAEQWGTFMNTDVVTSKKQSMDVARILIRTSCHNVVDEYLDVKINGELFSLRVLEDSYGPMRIMVPQPQTQDGRTLGDDESVEEGAMEDVEQRLPEEVESERESEGEEESLPALNFVNDANQFPIMMSNGLANSNQEGEVFEDNSLINNFEIHNTALIENPEEGRGDEEGGGAEVDNLNVKGGKSLGQEVRLEGPTFPISPFNIVTGGVIRRLSKSADMGQNFKPSLNVDGNSGGKDLRKEGVYSEGPRIVYNKLNSVPGPLNTKKLVSTPKTKELRHIPNFLPSNSLRKHQRMARSLASRKPNSVSANSVQSSTNECVSKETAVGVVAAKRSKPLLKPNLKLQATSLSSAGDVLCCSPLNSSDIRNCNQLIIKKHEEEVVSKVWNGAVELGVELDLEREKSCGEQGAVPVKLAKCILEIKENEKRDEDERARRGHKQAGFK
jgi:hypothetical protein